MKNTFTDLGIFLFALLAACSKKDLTKNPNQEATANAGNESITKSIYFDSTIIPITNTLKRSLMRNKLANKATALSADWKNNYNKRDLARRTS